MWPREQTEAGVSPNPPVGAANGEIVNAEEVARPKNPGSKFTYSSGTRPLDGFTIKRGVGIGGFGEVYFATSDAGKEVALKRIQRNLDIELRGVRQCLNLKHQNLVALYDIKYDEQEQAWVVMEFVPGASLKDIIDQHPTGMPIEDVHRWFRGLASGTAYLHDHGIVHRDLKPGNVFDDDGIVKIGDYGLSKFISCSRRSGQTESVGTFHYMAPEIGKGNYGREIDIYALGIILHEMLTGNVPFDGESTQEIIMKHLTADPDVSRLAQPYRYVIQRALLKDPQKRFHAVYEMVDALGLASPSDISTQRNVAARSLAPLEIDTPPIAIAPPPVNAISYTPRQDEPLFISDDAEMVFGPVKISSISADGPPVAPSAAVLSSAAQSSAAPVNFAPPQAAPASSSAPRPSSPSFASASVHESSAAPRNFGDVPTSAASSPSLPGALAASPIWLALDIENEPIASATMRALSGVTKWWSSPSLALTARIVVIVCILAAASVAVAFIPQLLLVLLGYAIYLSIRISVNFGGPKSRIAPTSHYSAPPSTYPSQGGLFTPSNASARLDDMAIPPIVSSPPRSYAVPASKREYVAPTKFALPPPAQADARRQNWAMLLTSMLVTSLLATAFSIVAILAIEGRTSIVVSNFNQVAQVTWLAVTCIASCWVILAVSRLFDTARSTTFLHRIVMGGCGAMIACGALALQQFLELGDLPDSGRFPSLRIGWPAPFSTVAFFFALFALIRWWKHADPMRSWRWKVGATLVAMILASLLGYLLHFPQPWPAAIAGVLSISLHLGSSRYSAEQRKQKNGPFAISA